MDGTCAKRKVDIVDGMAEFQSLDKSQRIKSFADLADYFSTRVLTKYSNSDELRLIFDRYDVQASLKCATRVIRQGVQEPIYYHIMDSIHTERILLKKLLSHPNTKLELTKYLSEKLLMHAKQLRHRISDSYLGTLLRRNPERYELHQQQSRRSRHKDCSPCHKRWCCRAMYSLTRHRCFCSGNKTLFPIFPRHHFCYLGRS